MKQAVSYILLLMYGFIIVRPAIPMADYVINYKHISQDLCENKDKPWMHCNGKCYLKKEIKKVMGDDNPNRKTTNLPQLKLKEYARYYRIHLLKKYFSFYNFVSIKTCYIVQKTNKGFLSDLIKPPPTFFFI